MKLVLTGKNGYSCTLGGSTVKTWSKVCSSVPGGDFQLRAQKQNNATVYIGSSWS